MAGLTIKRALSVALEGLNGDKYEWAIVHPKTLREHLCWWIKEYGLVRGVIFEDQDIADEIDLMVNRLRAGLEVDDE